MAQVMFKKGLSTALPKTGLVEGAFYLTTDTDKLYVCNDGEKLSLLNQVVHNVANIAALPAIADAAVGEFYYCIEENVLATKKAAADTSWTQINADTDTHLDPKECTQTTSVGSNIATVTTKLKQVNKDGSQSAYGNPEFSFKIKGAGDNTVTRETDGTIVITGKNDNTTYTLSTEATAADAAAKTGKIKLTPSSGSVQTVEVAGSGDIVVTSDAAGKLTVDGTALKDAIETAKDSVAISTVKNTFSADGGFTTAVGTKAGTFTAEPVTPIIRLGENSEDYKFKSGIATLPVYTKTEVDDKFKTADAMVYMGTISKADDLLAESTVKKGWTYKVTVTGKYAGTACRVGDLIIAKIDGTPTNDSTTWDVVPSGNDQTIVGNVTDTGIVISDSAADGGTLAGITMADGDCTTVAGTISGKVTTIKVNHNKATGTLAAGSTADVTQTAKGSADFSAITSISRDAYGHVTGTTVKKLHVVDTDTHNDISGVKVTAKHTSSGATVSTTVATNDTKGGITANFTISSDNLTITNGTADGTTAATSLKINLEWGSF